MARYSGQKDEKAMTHKRRAEPRRGDRGGDEHAGATSRSPDGRRGRPVAAGGQARDHRPRRRRRRRRPSPPPNRRSRPSPPPPTPVDGGWPRMYSLPSDGSILVYQPQIASWDKQTHLVAFSAVSYRSKAGDKPALGTIKLEADTKVAVSRSAGQLPADEDRRGQLPDAAEGADARDRRRRSTRRFPTTSA